MTQNVKIPPIFIQKILRVPVYRLALNDLVSRIIRAVYVFFSRLFGNKVGSFKPFDPKIAQKSLDRFVALGADVEFVTPRDGKGKVQMMTFCAQALEAKIVSVGGTWEKRTIDGKEVFAIVPPEKETDGWRDLKEKLSHFHWREVEGMLITCEEAEKVNGSNCFLYAGSTSSSFAAHWKRAGFYLGAKQDLCFFDNGNIWKNEGRPVSEGGFYLEAEAVYEKLQAKYSLDQLWVGGSCGGAPVAAYLKWRHHGEGINFFTEDSFPNFNDFKTPVSCLMPWVKGSLGGTTEMENPPPEWQFSVDQMWKDLPLSEKGKMVVIQLNEDEHISEEAYGKYWELAQVTNQAAVRIRYNPTNAWKHISNFFAEPEARTHFWEAIFSA